MEAILELTAGKGVGCAIECLGTEKTFQNSIKVTRPGSILSHVGCHGEGDIVGIAREAWGLGMSDKTIRTALCPGGRMRRMIRLIQRGRVDSFPLTPPERVGLSVRLCGANFCFHLGVAGRARSLPLSAVSGRAANLESLAAVEYLIHIGRGTGQWTIEIVDKVIWY